MATKESEARLTGALAKFPLEVWDLIVSVDSDLELRDHLALAGTCRYFRGCYRDVVFQVLFQTTFPSPTSNSYSSSVLISPSGHPYPERPLERPLGPLTRSLSSARRIFSSSLPLVGAGEWDGWALTREEYEANQLVSKGMEEELECALREFWRTKPVEWNEEVDSVLGPMIEGMKEEEKEEFRKECLRTMEEETRPEEVRGLRRVHGLVPEDMDAAVKVLYDPWPSVWRRKVAEVVNASADSDDENGTPDENRFAGPLDVSSVNSQLAFFQLSSFSDALLETKTASPAYPPSSLLSSRTV